MSARLAEPPGRAADTWSGALLALLVIALNAASVSAQLGFLHKAKQVKEYDHWRYIEMSRGPDGKEDLQREPPYCFRLAVPAAARALKAAGLPENAAFYLLSAGAVFAFLWLLWLHLRDLGFARSLRVAAILVVGLTQGAVRWPLYQYWMTDAAALALVMLAFFLLERGRWSGLVATSVLAAFVRETSVLVYPYVLLRERRVGRSWTAATLRAAALAALPFAVLAAIRRAITPNQPDSFVSGIVDTMGFRVAHVLDNQLYVVTIGAFGVLVPLVLLFPSRIPALLRRHFDRALFVLSVYATLLISNNNERPLAYALPALVPAALGTLRLFLRETRLPEIPVLAAVVGLQALFWHGQRFGEAGMSIYQPVNVLTVGAMAIAWLLGRAALRRAATQ